MAQQISRCFLNSAIWGAVLLSSTFAFADTIKVIHIKNPGPAAADMHVTFFGNTQDTRGLSTNGPSDHFGLATGVGGPTINYSMGALANGAVDDMTVKVMGNLPAGASFANLVLFTDATGAIIRRLDPNGTAQEKRDFANNVKGFTNHEYFDFSDPNNGQLFLLGEDPSLNISITLSNFAVFTDLSLSNFDVSNYRNTGAATPVFSAPSLTIGPGGSVNIPLGALQLGTYELATVDTITVQDFTTNQTTVYNIPQAYAQDDVPEPSTIALLGLGISVLVAYAQRPRRF